MRIRVRVIPRSRIKNYIEEIKRLLEIARWEPKAEEIHRRYARLRTR